MLAFHHSADALLRNRFPYVNEHGSLYTPATDAHRARLAGQEILGGGLFVGIIGIRADMKEHADTHRLNRWDNREAPCRKCGCSFNAGAPAEANPYFLGHGAYSRTRRRGVADWQAVPWALHPIFNQRTGLTPCSSWADLFHDGPGGSERYLLGGVYEDITAPDAGVLPGGTVGERVEFLGELIRTAYEDIGTTPSERLPDEFARTLWKSGPGYPELNTKFAITKHLIHATAAVLESLDNSTEQAQYRLMAVKNTSRMHDVVDREGLVMTQAGLQELEEAVTRLVAATIWLANDARARGIERYNVTMKLHDHIHIAQDARSTLINPRFTSTPLDEDFVGRVGKIVFSCVKRNGVSRATPRIIETLLRLILARSQTAWKVKWSVGT
jgi:hypothetical protein